MSPDSARIACRQTCGGNPLPERNRNAFAAPARPSGIPSRNFFPSAEAAAASSSPGRKAARTVQFDQVPGELPQVERPGDPARPQPAGVPVRPGKICAEGLVVHQPEFPEPGENVCGLRFREPLRLQPDPDLPFAQRPAGKHAEGGGQHAPRRGRLRLPLTLSGTARPCQNRPM